MSAIKRDTCDRAEGLLLDNLVWLTTKEAAVYLRVSEGQIRNMVWRGQLKSYHLQSRKICGWKDLETMQRYIRLAGIETVGVTEVLNILPPELVLEYASALRP